MATALAQPSCLSPLPTQTILFLSRKTSHVYPSSTTTPSQGLSASIRCRNLTHEAMVTMPQGSGVSPVAEAFDSFEHLLLPITDRNPYLSEGTRQVVATTAALAKKYGADITVIVIDEKTKESFPEHETRLSSIRRHLFEVVGTPTAIIGEVADNLNLDLVILSMEAVPLEAHRCKPAHLGNSKGRFARPRRYG